MYSKFNDGVQIIPAYASLNYRPNNIYEKIIWFWLAEKGVQKSVTRVQESVTPVQITHRNSGLWLANKQYGFWKNQSSLLLSNPARALDGATLWFNISLRFFCLTI